MAQVLIGGRTKGPELIVRGYKHVDPQFAAVFESGRAIKLGTFSYYRGLEGPRADPLEGIAINTPGPIRGDFRPDKPLSRAQLNALSTLFFSVSPGVRLTNVDISNNVSIGRVSDSYIFCCSSEPDLRLARKGVRIFEISDLLAFADTIQTARSDVLGEAWGGEVDYLARHVDPLNAPPAVPHPLFKSPACASEKELRLIWNRPPDTADESLKPFIIVDCPRAAKFISRVNLD